MFIADAEIKFTYIDKDSGLLRYQLSVNHEKKLIKVNSLGECRELSKDEIIIALVYKIKSLEVRVRNIQSGVAEIENIASDLGFI